MTNPVRFILKVGGEQRPIEILRSILEGRLFDFESRTADFQGVPIIYKDQRLSDTGLCPIHLERRGRGGKRLLVFIVDDPDDLLISVAGWQEAVEIDLSREGQGEITITNSLGDWYQFRIHK